MFRIRPEHVENLAAQQVESFVERMVLHLREVFPAEVRKLDDARLRSLVKKTAARAEELDIVEESHIERLLELFVCFDPIRRDPLPDWISRIVRDPYRSAERVLDELEERFRFEEGR